MTSIPNNFSHSHIPYNWLTPTSSQTSHNSFLPDRIPTTKGVPWKRISTMIRHDKLCLGCNFNNPDDSPCLKFHQEVGCPVLDKNGYVFKKDVTEAATILDNFNKKFPMAPDQPRPNQGTGERRAIEG